MYPRGLFVIGSILFLSQIPLAFAAPGDNCWERITDMCGLLSADPQQVFGAVLTPLESQITGLSLALLWGGLLTIIWFKTENVMLLGIVGVVVSSTITGLSSQAQGIGMLLLAVSIGILLFQLIRQRVSVFS